MRVSHARAEAHTQLLLMAGPRQPLPLSVLLPLSLPETVVGLASCILEPHAALPWGIISLPSREQTVLNTRQYTTVFSASSEEELEYSRNLRLFGIRRRWYVRQSCPTETPTEADLMPSDAFP